MIGPVGDISVCDKSMQTILNCLHNRGFMGMFACVCVFVKEPDSTVPSTCELHDDRLVL